MKNLSKINHLYHNLSNVYRYAHSQVEALYQHPLNRSKKSKVWRDFVVDQLSARLGRTRLQICPFLDGSQLALSTFTAPGIHWARMNCLHEHEEMQLFADLLGPDDAFIDVGANAGAFSVIAITKKVRQVIAYEPSSKTHWITEITFRMNGANSILHQVRKQAVGAEIGEALITNTLGGTDHVLRVPGPEINTEHETITVVTLDSLLSEIGSPPRARILAIKIDAEGGDFDVISGGLKLINNSPACFVCVEMNCNQELIASLLASQGFTQVRYDVKSRTLRESHELTLSNNGLFIKGFSGSQMPMAKMIKLAGLK